MQYAAFAADVQSVNQCSVGSSDCNDSFCISFLSFLSFYFFSMNVALAEVKQKKTFGFGKHNVGREYKIPYAAVPVCFSPNLQHFLLFQNWACLREIASLDTFYGGFVPFTNGDENETSRLILVHDLKF